MTTFAIIATVPERAESLRKATNSLRSQVDRLFVYQNEDWGVLPGDSGKFSKLGIIDCDYYLTCDDDLVYPPDYVKRMVDFAYKYDSVVTCHGRKFVGEEVTSYYHGPHLAFRCLGEVTSPAYVDVPGSGVSVIPKRLQEPIASAMPPIEVPNASDMYLAVALKRIGERAVVMPHDAGWIKSLHEMQKRNVYSECHKNETVQPAMLREVLS